MGDTTTAEASIEVKAPPEEIWSTLTDRERLRRFFMGADVRTDWNEGSPITFTGEYEGKTYEDKGEVLEADSPRRLRFSHWSPLAGKPDEPENYHVVEIALDPDDADDDATTVTLSQSNLTGEVTDEDRANREQYERNWQSVLEGLKDVVEA